MKLITNQRLFSLLPKFLFFAQISVFYFVFQACDTDPCDEGYTQIRDNGMSICVPDYIMGIEKSGDYGNRFYHDNLGLIEFNNGKWTNQYGENVSSKL